MRLLVSSIAFQILWLLRNAFLRWNAEANGNFIFTSLKAFKPVHCAVRAGC